MSHRAIRAYDSRIRRTKVTVGFADITAAGMSKTLDLAALLLPADAYLLGFDLNLLVLYTDGAAGTVKMDIGVAGTGAAFLTGAANNLGATLGRKQGGTVTSNGVPSFQPSTQVRLTFTGSVNLNTLTAGSVEVGMIWTKALLQNDLT